MEALQEFFYMDGYAFYVWTSYALALIVLVINVVAPVQREREIRRRLARNLRRKQYDTRS